MPVKLTAEEYADKQAARLKAATEDIRRGVARVTVAPTKLAAEKADKMLANLTKAVQSGKWATRLKAVSLEDWQDAMITKGIGRIPTGIDGARDKVIRFAEQLIPHIETGQRKIESMADLTLEDNVQRMVTFVRHMATFSYK